MTHYPCLAGSSPPRAHLGSGWSLGSVLSSSGPSALRKVSSYTSSFCVGSRTNLKTAYSKGFFGILKVKADFLSLLSILPRILSYSNILIATQASQLHIILALTDKTDLHLRASLCFLPVHQAKNTSTIPARHPGLPSDKQIIG